MSASIRAHANLNLYLAEQAISALDQDLLVGIWGEHAELVASDLAIQRLQLAYRCHLGDLCEQKLGQQRPQTAATALDALAALNESIPEVVELAEKEETQWWLSQLLAENFLPSAGPEQHGAPAELIARSEDRSLGNAETLRQVLAELKELIARHRDSQQEY